MDTRIRTILLNEPHIPRFEQADPTATSEATFEMTTLQLLARLYPSCLVITFKPLVINNGVGWRPDVAVIEKTLSYWFVIEVEIATHSLEKHVLPQVRAFRDGDYGQDSIKIIARATAMSVDRVATLIRYVPRYIAVVSNHENQAWEKQLAAENVQYISIAAYERPAGAPAYLLTGLLKAAERSVGFGTVLASYQAIRIPRSDFWDARAYRVLEPDGAADWDCFVDDRVVWLTKRRGIVTLPDSAWVQLIAQDDNRILLRPLC